MITLADHTAKRAVCNWRSYYSPVRKLGKISQYLKKLGVYNHLKPRFLRTFFYLNSKKEREI